MKTVPLQHAMDMIHGRINYISAIAILGLFTAGISAGVIYAQNKRIKKLEEKTNP